MTGRLAWGALLAGLAMTAARAGQPLATEAQQPAAPHSHAPIELDLPPVVTRFAAALSQPRRVIIASDGAAFVADWGRGALLRVAPDGARRVAARGLAEPAGLAFDASGALYIAAHAGGVADAGSIHRLRPDGTLEIFTEGLTGPTALAVRSDGTVYVASFANHTVVEIEPDGRWKPFATGLAGPAALAIGPDGSLYCACSSDGTILRLDRDGMIELVARDLAAPSDLAFDSAGRLVAVCYGSGELVHVRLDGATRAYAVVPAGTIGAAFDQVGNLLLVNWDDASLLRVVTQTSIRCPHCGAEIPLRLRQPPVLPRTPAADDGPVI